jgi:hypothetical protein
LQIPSALWNAQIRDPLDFLLNPPLFAAYQTTATTAWTGWAAQGVQSVIVDTYGGWSSGSPTRYTAQVTGWYMCTGVTCFGTSSSGWRSCGLSVNGTHSIGTCQDMPASPDFPCVAAVPTPIFLNASDYVEMIAYTNVSVATNVTISDLRTRFNVAWIHQ